MVNEVKGEIYERSEAKPSVGACGDVGRDAPQAQSGVAGPSWRGLSGT
ncbi:hypothetical protein ODS41_11885 [Pyrobaculum sp. 3827-6]|jgi:hypothetical protein|nr:hypothetical protein [Pyrobaculum sp. 3827-6]MCU7788612.1 hypothetical protein [Pyrobaculum sp. 3827-6]